MKRFLDIYKAIAKRTLMFFFQYRIGALSWLVGKILEPLIFMVIWRVTAQSKGWTTTQYSPNDFVCYYIILMIISHITFTYLIWDFGSEIISGKFSRKLLLPLHPIHYDLAENFGYKVFSLPVICLSAVLLGYLFKAQFEINYLRLAYFIPALIQAFFLRFLIEWTVALSAFWLKNIRAVNQIYYLLLIFFSGRVAPLDLFPASIRTLARLLPFRFMVSFPVEIILGKIPPNEIWLGFLLQLVWLVSAWTIYKVVWILGVRKYTAVGI